MSRFVKSIIDFFHETSSGAQWTLVSGLARRKACARAQLFCTWSRPIRFNQSELMKFNWHQMWNCRNSLFNREMRLRGIRFHKIPVRGPVWESMVPPRHFWYLVNSSPLYKWSWFIQWCGWINISGYLTEIKRLRCIISRLYQSIIHYQIIVGKIKGVGSDCISRAHSAICGKLGTDLQAYTLSPGTKSPTNPIFRKVNT